MCSIVLISVHILFSWHTSYNQLDPFHAWLPVHIQRKPDILTKQVAAQYYHVCVFPTEFNQTQSLTEQVLPESSETKGRSWKGMFTKHFLTSQKYVHVYTLGVWSQFSWQCGVRYRLNRHVLSLVTAWHQLIGGVLHIQGINWLNTYTCTGVQHILHFVSINQPHLLRPAFSCFQYG